MNRTIVLRHEFRCNARRDEIPGTLTNRRASESGSMRFFLNPFLMPLGIPSLTSSRCTQKREATHDGNNHR